MKNKGYVNLIATIIVIIVLVIIYLIKYNSRGIDDTIKNIKWYRYDYNTSYYEIFYMENDSFNYTVPNDLETYKDCNKYTFDKKKNRLNLNCGKNIDIVSKKDTSLVLGFNSIEKVFFNNIEDSLNYEFKSYFNKSISEFKKDKRQVLDFIKIDSNKISEVLDDNNYRIVLLGDNCTSVECALILNNIEKWVVKDTNVYYVYSTDMDVKIEEELYNKLGGVNDVEFDGIYPFVITYNKNKLDYYRFKCEGFDCSKNK